MTNEYLQRQLKLMLRQIQYFEDGVLSIHDLRGDLRFLRNHIEDTDPRWEEFDGLWGVLDEASSFAIVKNNGRLLPEDEEQVKKAVPEIVALVRTAFKDSFK